MSVIDILTRVDSICKKYDKYDVDKQRGDAGNFAGDDAFARLYSSVEADMEAALHKSELASQEKNRAAVVAMNAEIRRTKAKLLEEVPKLQRLALKKVKGLTKEELAARNDMVLALPDRIQSIPDGTSNVTKQTGGWTASASRTEIKFDNISGERRTALIREAIHTRYSLLPYYYSLFRKASVSGIPIMRPLWLEFPEDKETFDNSEAFMVGESILVQGIYEEGQKTVSVYLPGDQSWYNLRNGAAYSGGQTHKLEVFEESIPSFQRAGSIVPRKYRFRRSTTQMANDPYTLVIALNSSLAAEGELYIDDGKSYDFEQGAFIHRRFVFSNGKLTSSSIHSAPLGQKKFSSSCTVERIILLGLPSGAKKAVIEPGNHETEIEPGPLTLRGGASSVALVIRKPNVRIADDWTIKVL